MGYQKYIDKLEYFKNHSETKKNEMSNKPWPCMVVRKCSPNNVKDKWSRSIKISSNIHQTNHQNPIERMGRTSKDGEENPNPNHWKNIKKPLKDYWKAIKKPSKSHQKCWQLSIFLNFWWSFDGLTIKRPIKPALTPLPSLTISELYLSGFANYQH